MKTTDFECISMNGRMAYSILCVEAFLLNKYPSDDWTILSKLMWKSTSSLWDEWDKKYIEIIPEYLFEKNTYEESDFESLSKEEYEQFSTLLHGKENTVNQILLKIQDLYEIYCYSSIPGHGTEASQIVVDIVEILKESNITPPDISLVQFSHFSEKNGWGNCFDGEALSLILQKKL